MPIIPKIGRKALRIRAMIVFIYAFLAIGSITTVYPFLLMLATSVSSHTDYEEYRLIPRYLQEDGALFTKYFEEKYRRQHFELFKLRYHVKEPYTVMLGGQEVQRKYGRFAELEREIVEIDLSDEKVMARLADWRQYKASADARFKDTFHHSPTLAMGEVQLLFQSYIKEKYPTIEEAQVAIAEPRTVSYILIVGPFEAYARHGWAPTDEKKSRLWYEFKKTLPSRLIHIMTAKPLWQKFLQDEYGKVAKLNDAWDAGYEYFWQIPFPLSRPEGAPGVSWEKYVRSRHPIRYAKFDVALAGGAWREYLEDKYGTVEKYNGFTGSSFSSLDAVELSEHLPEKSLEKIDWKDFYETAAPIDGILIDSADVHYQRFLEEKYGSVASLNQAYGTGYATLTDVEPPWREDDYEDLMTHRRDLRWHYLTRNYVYVFKRVFLQGRPLINTFILVVLTVGAQVTINPLAAYALSRYRLPYASKVLVFMLATMAFPPEVTMIPNFLMIRNLGMLNTFGALILPRLANGYYIFLLKGFFDSLPQELYEAGSIDGASEIRMFWTITLPLSLPVLAVIGLYSFGQSYGSFLWAFTTCQDKKMWTLMVFLHQFEQTTRSSPYVVMAALVLAAIPTIVVFLSAQRILMKGIVVPTMK